LCFPVPLGYSYINQSDGISVLVRLGTQNARDGDADVGRRMLQGAFGHRFSHFCADRGMLRDESRRLSKGGYLILLGVYNAPSMERLGRSALVSEQLRKRTRRAGFCCRDR
jgi:hypothetical protein